MSRADQLRRSALKWKVIGGLAFLLGAFMLYQKVYYESKDFYGNNFEVYRTEMSRIKLADKESAMLDSAMTDMQGEQYWEAVTKLEKLKQSDPGAVQIAEWYKILCMVGLEEKKEAKQLLEYYVEQPDFDFNMDKAEALLKEY